MENVEQRVKDVVAAQTGVRLSEVKLESNLVDDLGADSLDLVELTMEIEDEFELELSDEVMSGFRTVQDIVTYVSSK